MRKTGGIAGLLLLLSVLVMAVPALATEEGLTEVASSDCDESFTHCLFARTLINDTEDPIDVAPRDLNDPEYPVLTLVTITVGTFTDGIWTVGTLGAGETAYLEYTGDKPAATTTTVVEETTTTQSPTTTLEETTTTEATTTTTVATSVLSSATETTTTTEALPYTGSDEHLAGLAIVGLALVGMGTALLRAARD